MAKKRTTPTTAPPAEPELDAGGVMGPVLQLVRDQSVPELDACQEEILRQEQDAHPPLPCPDRVPAASWAGLVNRRAS